LGFLAKQIDLFNHGSFRAQAWLSISKRVVLKIFKFKNSFFSTFTFKKIFKFIKLHFEIIEHFIDFIVSWTKFEKFLYKKSGWKLCFKLDGCSNSFIYFYIKTLIDYDYNMKS
jgi:hypothetical protein